jgi:hypothetical protein
MEQWNGGQGPGGPSVVSCQLSVVSSMAAGKARKARKGTAEGKRLRLVGSEQEQRARAWGPLVRGLRLEARESRGRRSEDRGQQGLTARQ